MYKRIVGVLSGALAITLVTLGYSSVNALSRAESQSIQDKEAINRIIDSTAIAENCSDFDKVEYTEKGDYSKLVFSDVDEFLNSLQSLVRVQGADTLYEQRVYDSSDKDMVSLYESKDENVVVAVNPEGKIEYCMFKNLDSSTQDEIKRLSTGSEYKYKVVNGGFILEPVEDSL